MSKKKLKSDGIKFCGNAADEVTGSQYLVKFGDYKCLLECGLYQSSKNDRLDSYTANAEPFKFDPTTIDYVFVAHPHIDHCGLLPRLIKEGFDGEIITTEDTAAIMRPLLYNSQYIAEDDARFLSRKFKRNYHPIYSKKDVEATLNHISIYEEYDHIYTLNDTISFQWLRNSHCLGAAQLQLIFHNEKGTKKILYTSDLGALHTSNHFLIDSEIPTMFNDVVIMESTYGKDKLAPIKKRNFDISHLQSAIETTIDRDGCVVMPCFSFSRTQEILATLYDMYHDDESFKIPIIVDSKLSCDISKLYSKILTGENLEYWNRIYNWENIRFVSTPEESRAVMTWEDPRIIISSSGFCTNGRILIHLEHHLCDSNSTIIFSGYIGDNPSYLSYKIKNYKNYKNLRINKRLIRNRADCITLSTFSSHANYQDLVKFGSSMNTNQLILVHGTAEGKQCLANDLRDAIHKNDKSFKVTPAYKGMIIHF